MSSKTCKKCRKVKPLSEFYPYSPPKTGLRPRCKDCYADEGRDYRGRPEVAAHRRVAQKERDKNRVRDLEQLKRHRLWTWYRLTPERYDAMVEEQGGTCAICPATEPGGRGRWHVDHDHDCCPGDRSCGRCVRGLLCSRCNPMIGMAGDCADILRKGADYLDIRKAMKVGDV